MPFNDPMFTIGPAVMTIFFILFMGMILFTIIKGISTWNYNNAQPRLTVWAKVISKRTDVSSHSHNNGDAFQHSSSTTYYVTFEVESGDRMEFHVSGEEFGLLAELDKGNLTFQGSRYLGFKRNAANTHDDLDV